MLVPIKQIIYNKKIMLKKRRRLILVSVDPIKIQEKKQGVKTGNQIEVWKYTFFDKDLNVIEAFSPNMAFGDRVVDLEELAWDDKKANDYYFQIKLFRGKQSESLLVQ